MQSVGKGEIDGLTLSGVIGAIVEDETKLLLALEEDLVPHEIVESFRRLMLRSVEMDQVRQEFAGVGIILVRQIRVDLLSCFRSFLGGWSSLLLGLSIEGGLCSGFLLFLSFLLFLLLLKSPLFLLTELFLLLFVL